nr:FtsX-like permease family protein [uncultured Draconibacterium sp.]
MYSFKITIRRLVKDKAFSAINIFGLVIGIVSFLVLFIHVSNEKSFDKHFEGHENIYRVASTFDGREGALWARSLGIIHTASAEIPEIELATQFSHCDVGTIKINENAVRQNDIMSVDEAFIKMFNVETILGDLSEITKPKVVFISEDFAKKYFGNTNPIGKTIDVEALQFAYNLGDYEIRGVVKNTHPKSHLKYELLLSQKGGMLEDMYAKAAIRKLYWAYNYFKLRNGVAPNLVADKVKAFYDDSSLKSYGGINECNFELFPIDAIHLNSDFRYELRESSSKINIGLFVSISFVILVVSLLNFANLSIAKLIKRSKELGLKKSIGANHFQILKQVLVETFIICGIAIGISLLAIHLATPVVNQLFEIEFDIYYNEPVVYLSILAVMLVCLGLTAFFVFMFLVVRKTTVDILAERNNFSGNYLLKSLLVVQVSIVIILISGTFLVNKQINFILNKPLGFEKENVVVVCPKDIRSTSKDPAIFTNDLKRQSSVISVGMKAQSFGITEEPALDNYAMGMEGSMEMVLVNYDYLKTMNIRLIKDWINPDVDTIRGMVINNHLYKSVLQRHGSMEALEAYQKAQFEPLGLKAMKILGVTEDFNYNSAHKPIGDFAFILDESLNRARYIHVRLNNLHNGMDAVKRTWERHYPGQEMIYYFLDDRLAQQYKAETILSRILYVFSGLAIFISIIGISALAFFISQQRTKEIGVRKVNGANVSEILALLNKGFIKWVVIAFVIACPVACYAMNKWLENFAYKTELSWWIFALAGVLALGIALLTVSWQSWKAATRNPVEALRYE